MTGTASTPRPLAAAITAMVAFALLAAPLPWAFATSDTASPMSAKTRGAAVAAPAAAPAVRPATASATDFGSIFAGQLPALVNAGWSGCAAPVTWTIDTGSLSADESAEEIANLTWAFAQWSQASGLAFTFGGTQQLTYSDAAFSLAPADGTPILQRHIYLAFVADASSDRLGGQTVGLGSPSQVFTEDKEIVTGTAIFRTDHVLSAIDREDRSLYLHELGHVLGLAHAADAGNIMYPVVSDHLELGAGDVAGVRTMAKPCTETAVTTTL